MRLLFSLLVYGLFVTCAGSYVPTVTCTFSTGNCSGVGGGSSLFIAGTCNGSTDDSSAFVSFNSWSVGTWQASHIGKITLVLPANKTCLIGAAGTSSCDFALNQCPFIHIKNLQVSGGPNTTLNVSNVVSFGGNGIHQNNFYDIPTATVTKGSSCVTLQLQSTVLSITAIANNGSGLPRLTVSNTAGYSNGQIVFINNLSNTTSDFTNGNDVIVNVIDSTHLDATNRTYSGGYTSGAKIGDVTSIFTVGLPVLMTGLDLQGVWSSPFGFPPNAQFWDFLHVASVNAGTGQVCFTSRLTYDYLSTWPRYNSGNAGEVDAGGPATLYALYSSWDAIVEFDNLTINNAGQTIANNDTVIWNGVTFSNNSAVPSQNAKWKLLNSTASTAIEVDKLIDSVVINSSTLGQLFFQSASVKTLALTNTTLTQLQGSAIVTTGSNNHFTTTMKVGAVAYGRSTSFSCSGCVVAALEEGGVNDTGPGGHGVQTIYTMSSGTIKAPNGTTITGASNNAGAVKLQVVSTAGFATGQWLNVMATSIYDGAWQITVDDSTHMTLSGSTFTAGVTSGIAGGGAVPWAVPGANIMFIGTNGVESIGQVTAVTQDANFTYIATTFSGGFPADVSRIKTHPAPKFNCPSCTGAAIQIASLAQAPTDAPLYSYQTYTFPGTIGNAFQQSFKMWGALSQLEINVTNASSSASQFHLSGNDNWPVYVSGSASSYGSSVAAATGGDRKVDSSGTITCNGSGGACSGSDSLTKPAGLWFGAESFSGPRFATAPNAVASVTVTLQTNQGVVP